MPVALLATVLGVLHAAGECQDDTSLLQRRSQTSTPCSSDGILCEALRQAMSGPVLCDRESQNYSFDSFNRQCEKLVPFAVVRPINATEVQSAVNLARQYHRTFSVRGGGHNYACTAFKKDSVHLDMRNMTYSSFKDLGSHGEAILGPGLTNGDLYNIIPDGYQFAVGSCPTVGVAGYLLHGGSSPNTIWLGNTTLFSIDVVTADGQILTVSESSPHDGLWTALRQAGSSFAVATSFTLRLPKKPQRQLYFLPVLGSFEQILPCVRQPANDSKPWIGIFRFDEQNPFPIKGWGFKLAVPFGMSLQDIATWVNNTCTEAANLQLNSALLQLASGTAKANKAGATPPAIIPDWGDGVEDAGSSGRWFDEEHWQTAANVMNEFYEKHIDSCWYDLGPLKGSGDPVFLDISCYTIQAVQDLRDWINEHWAIMNAGAKRYNNLPLKQTPCSAYWPNYDELSAIKDIWDPTDFFDISNGIHPSGMGDCSKNTATIKVAGVGRLTCNNPPSGVIECLNIPYASPPVGALRFLPPVPPKSELGNFDATQRGPSCWQPSCLMNTSECSEDCLQLNIWLPQGATKEHGSKKFPVFFWLYGGYFSAGSSRRFDGSEYAKKGVIAVVINFREGALGYLGLPEIAAETDGTDGSLNGILDAVRALEWVNQYIGSFGGDRDRITIAGQSSGALTVAVLMKLDLARGLFQQAILESGTWHHPWEYLAFNFTNIGYPNRTTGTALLLSELGIADGDLPALQALPVQQIAAAKLWTVPPFQDGFHLTKQPWELPLLPGIKNVLMGTTSMDSLLAPNIVSEAQLSVLTGLPDPLSYTGLLAVTLGPQALAYYPVSNFSQPREIWTAYYAAQADVCNVCPTYWAASDISSAKGNIGLFLYHYSYNRAPNFRALTPHGGEIASVFNSYAFTTTYTPDLGDQILKYWTSFVKSGKPEARVPWPRFSSDMMMLKVSTDLLGQADIVSGIGPSLDHCKYFQKFISNLSNHQTYNLFCNGILSSTDVWLAPGLPGSLKREA